MDLSTLIIVLLLVIAVSEAIKNIKNNRPVGHLGQLFKKFT